MTKKPGIFDPWRQEAPPMPEPQSARPVDGPEDNYGVGQHHIRFAGRRAGFVVWLNEDDPERIVAQAKTNVLVALTKLMGDQSLYAIFHKWNITHEPVARDNYTVISDGGRKVCVQGDYEAGIDAIAFAFREAARTKESVEKYIISLGIRAYVR